VPELKNSQKQEDGVPTYVYQCTECGHGFEKVQAFSDDALTTCPQCQGKLRKVFNSVGIVFKGSGFYRNDSRSEAKTASTTASSDGKSSESKPSESKGSDTKTSESSSSSSSSSDSKPSAGSSASSSGSSSSSSSSSSGSAA
jgi:putative FmdB family regulatory protein